MKVIKTKISGVLIIEPKVLGDERGFFMDTWRQQQYAGVGIAKDFVQDNLPSSNRGALR